MLLPNCLVLFSIFCIVFQDADALPKIVKRNVTIANGQDLVAEADNSGSEGIHMFPKKIHFGVPNSPQKKGFQLWARPQDAGGSDSGDGGGTTEGDGSIPPEGSSQAPGGSTTPGKGRELTISVPSYKVDDKGNWVYNPWGATFGKLWQDTRFNFKNRPTIPRIQIDSNAPSDYYPKKENRSTVCMGRSTVYNRPRIEKWLQRRVANYRYERRQIWPNLRRAIFDLGKSEECHKTALSDWMGYQMCALRRNQRMEYAVPKYPLHQLNV